MNLHILVLIITISALHAADYNQLKVPDISRRMSLTKLHGLDRQAGDIQHRSRVAFHERKEDLLTQSPSKINLKELEMLNTILTREQHTKTKRNERVCCASIACVGMGGLLTYEALHNNTEDPNLSCLAVGLGAALLGIIESTKIIMQPTIKHKIEEIQQAIQEKKQEKSE